MCCASSFGRISNFQQSLEPTLDKKLILSIGWRRKEEEKEKVQPPPPNPVFDKKTETE